jgi:hypothetical protein
LGRPLLYPRCGFASCWERVRQRRQALGLRRRRRPRHLRAKAEAQAVFRTELEAWVEEGPAEEELLVVEEATWRRHPP